MSVEAPHLGVHVATPVFGKIPHAREDVVPQQVLKDGPLIGRFRLQELRELTLRKHHRLDEFVVAESKQLDDGFVHWLDLVGDVSFNTAGDLGQCRFALQAGLLALGQPGDADSRDRARGNRAPRTCRRDRAR